MDYEVRITRVETMADNHQRDTARLHEAIADLRKLIAGRDMYIDQQFKEQRQYIDDSLKEQRTYIDDALKDQRKYIDDSLKEQRTYVNNGFEEIRREAAANMRTTVTLTLVNTSMILGVAGRVFGLY